MINWATVDAEKVNLGGFMDITTLFFIYSENSLSSIHFPIQVRSYDVIEI